MADAIDTAPSSAPVKLVLYYTNFNLEATVLVIN